jgi:hypothetical protein
VALQARDVGHGTERDEVEQIEDLRFGERLENAAAPQLPEQGDAEQEGHADRREVAMRRAVLALVEPVGIDQRIGERKLAGALVMVDDDHIQARISRFFQRVERLRAAINADGDACAFRLQFDERFARWAVTLHQPVGDIDHRLGAEPPEQQHEQRGAGRAVDVVIAEDGDRLALLHGVGEPPGALVHVRETAGVGEEVADPRVTVTGEVLARHAAGEQQVVNQRVHSQPRLGRPSPAPGLAAHGSFDVEGGHHSSERKSRRFRGLGATPLFCGYRLLWGGQACRKSRSSSVNHGTDVSKALPPAIRSNSITRSWSPRSSS